ncbi:pyruvate/2-oxoglutarate dehydrogenase complex dihydrolipoamide dehydrogenase (E3) component [Dyadobacter jejuensis]|uniref:Pyruvate/2-oxoglutarate dehydrogenase complex dihydrolipoamide dehydrogenase (E3) component n=1 Tax=Dyadobacter jejuensis TaxID=1082580 RepID=A0A316API7_9BACT|nr:NAD(P)/FAD-dependent oxidoreductase [Dyadobacter jejuensis]PWJ58730.1 pyruvate/2-oxoglutarate dehydrogenase complex dihydrolipoamide dehydrogenase (E3) component [Dyadobacter jejuensis]
MENSFDMIVIGAGSGGLGVSLFMAKIGLKTLIVDESDAHIGGDCLNYGCVPSKALIHVSRLVSDARKSEDFGMSVSGQPDIAKVMQYVVDRQEVIRKHENADFLRQEGLEVVLGRARFHSSHSIIVNGTVYTGRKIVLATGSSPRALDVPGVDLVRVYDNESLFGLHDFQGRKLLVVGGGPIGVEIGQALLRLGVQVTLVHRGAQILPKEEPEIAAILHQKLEEEGMQILLNTQVHQFTAPNEALLVHGDRIRSKLDFDSVFASIGRTYELGSLDLEKVGIETEKGKIKVNQYLQTTNKDIFTAGDIAGYLQFSHAAEQHTRLLLNNLFSPLKKKLSNDHMSWVTFTDPEIATFGLQKIDMDRKGLDYERLVMGFEDDDRAVVDSYRYGKLVLYISKGGLLRKQKILGGSMIAPNAGELIQELILANTMGLDIDAIFNKIYPYPVASRVNQMIIVKQKEKILTPTINTFLRKWYRFLN